MVRLDRGVHILRHFLFLWDSNSRRFTCLLGGCASVHSWDIAAIPAGSWPKVRETIPDVTASSQSFPLHDERVGGEGR